MLNLNIKSTNMEMTPVIKEYIHKKVGSLEKFISPDKDAEVQVQVQVWVEVGLVTKHHHSGDIFRAEIQVRVPHNVAGGGVRAVSEKPDIYVAIDDAKDQVKRELTQLKAKRKSIILRGARKIKRLFLGQ